MVTIVSPKNTVATTTPTLSWPDNFVALPERIRSQIGKGLNQHRTFDALTRNGQSITFTLDHADNFLGWTTSSTQHVPRTLRNSHV